MKDIKEESCMLPARWLCWSGGKDLLCDESYVKMGGFGEGEAAIEQFCSRR